MAAYNTLVSLQRTEDTMVQSEGNLDNTVVDVVDNAAETLIAFEMQSNEFKRTQSDFEDYMERLKEDIDQKADNLDISNITMQNLAMGIPMKWQLPPMKYVTSTTAVSLWLWLIRCLQNLRNCRLHPM